MFPGALKQKHEPSLPSVFPPPTQIPPRPQRSFQLVLLYHSHTPIRSRTLPCILSPASYQPSIKAANAWPWCSERMRVFYSVGRTNRVPSLGFLKERFLKNIFKISSQTNNLINGYYLKLKKLNIMRAFIVGKVQFLKPNPSHFPTPPITTHIQRYHHYLSMPMAKRSKE